MLLTFQSFCLGPTTFYPHTRHTPVSYVAKQSLFVGKGNETKCTDGTLEMFRIVPKRRWNLQQLLNSKRETFKNGETSETQFHYFCLHIDINHGLKLHLHKARFIFQSGDFKAWLFLPTCTQFIYFLDFELQPPASVHKYFTQTASRYTIYSNGLLRNFI